MAARRLAWLFLLSLLPATIVSDACVRALASTERGSRWLTPRRQWVVSAALATALYCSGAWWLLNWQRQRSWWQTLRACVAWERSNANAGTQYAVVLTLNDDVPTAMIAVAQHAWHAACTVVVAVAIVLRAVAASPVTAAVTACFGAALAVSAQVMVQS